MLEKTHLETNTFVQQAGFEHFQCDSPYVYSRTDGPPKMIHQVSSAINIILEKTHLETNTFVQQAGFEHFQCDSPYVYSRTDGPPKMIHQVSSAINIMLEKTHLETNTFVQQAGFEHFQCDSPYVYSRTDGPPKMIHQVSSAINIMREKTHLETNTFVQQAEFEHFQCDSPYVYSRTDGPPKMIHQVSSAINIMREKTHLETNTFVQQAEFEHFQCDSPYVYSRTDGPPKMIHQVSSAINIMLEKTHLETNTFVQQAGFEHFQCDSPYVYSRTDGPPKMIHQVSSAINIMREKTHLETNTFVQQAEFEHFQCDSPYVYSRTDGPPKMIHQDWRRCADLAGFENLTYPSISQTSIFPTEKMVSSDINILRKVTHSKMTIKKIFLQKAGFEHSHVYSPTEGPPKKIHQVTRGQANTASTSGALCSFNEWITEYANSSKVAKYRVLEYVVQRETYGRLDYNAKIALRISEKLRKAGPHVPGIVNCSEVKFRALMPKSESCQLDDDEGVRDITGDWTEPDDERKRRWVILFPDNETPVEIPKGDETLYLAGTVVKTLKNDSHVRKFITFSFENEIFAYAEQAYRYVQDKLNSEHEQEELELAKLEIRSLLARKLPEHNTPDTDGNQSMDRVYPLSSTYQDVKKALDDKRLQKCGIGGFCITPDGSLILVVEPALHSERESIVNQIKENLGNCWEDSKILWVKKITISDLAGRGGKLSKQQSFATLGCFGEKDDHSLVAITAGHFAKLGEAIDVNEGNATRELGTCIESHYSPDVDIAVININADMVPSCETEFHNENGEISPACVYAEDKIDSWPVHKVGAATGYTSGIVYSGIACVFPNEKGIVISGNTDDAVFAAHGDSGSIVFFYDPEDIDNKAIKLLSIVSQGMEVTARARPIGLSSNPILTHNLRDCLNRLRSSIRL